MKIRSEVLLSDSRHTKNATIHVDVRNLYHTPNNLYQPSAVKFELTPEGARTLIAHLQLVLELPEKTEYIILSNGVTRVDGVDYDSTADYLNNTPSAE